MSILEIINADIDKALSYIDMKLVAIMVIILIALIIIGEGQKTKTKNRLSFILTLGLIFCGYSIFNSLPYSLKQTILLYILPIIILCCVAIFIYLCMLFYFYKH
ncbi:MAG: hypothetical protein ACLR3R_18730 [Clostridium paraputrificum]